MCVLALHAVETVLTRLWTETWALWISARWVWTTGWYIRVIRPDKAWVERNRLNFSDVGQYEDDDPAILR